MQIAINAQINPKSPGGVESNLFSLLQSLPEPAATYTILADPAYSEALAPWLQPQHQRLTFRGGQQNYTHPAMLVGRWGQLRRTFGPTSVDPAYRLYSQLKTRLTTPAPAQTDRYLQDLGINAIHFPYSQYFETQLPFLYEPWDLQHRHYPAFFTPEEIAWRDQLYQTGCQKARLIVTATDWTKQDIVQQYGIAPDKIKVIPRSSLMFRAQLTPAEKAVARQHYQLPERFALYPAMTFAHKNHIHLLQALAQLKQDHRITLPLLCTGRIYQPHWPKVEAEMQRLGLENQVHFLGAVTDDHLCALFNTATLMVFPSLFEGLGLPLLEAMHHGLPILAARATCIPEVVGDAAMLFAPEHPDDIAQNLKVALQDPERLETLTALGRSRLTAFSWQKAAQAFLACYKSVSSKSPNLRDNKHSN
jgi:glycosyltransferase involved in cell wall biosynthesis